MSVRYDYWTGHQINRCTSLKRSISGLTRGRRPFKIGITCKPERRWAQAYGKDYLHMVVLYETRSERYIRRIEKNLTLWYEGYSDNLRLGGGGPDGTGPYYLYVVLG